LAAEGQRLVGSHHSVDVFVAAPVACVAQNDDLIYREERDLMARRGNSFRLFSN
jgi:hypothetical protein